MDLFTDGSVAPREKVGIGGYQLIESFAESLETDQDEVRLKRFDNVSSTDLELKTLIWALSEIGKREDPVEMTVYTDSQNIISLLDRRRRLETSGFKNRSGKRLNLADDYERFYALLDDLKFSIVKVKGHRRKAERSSIERVFSRIDQATRRELRKLLSQK